MEVITHTFFWEAWEDDMPLVQPVGHTALVSWTRMTADEQEENPPRVVVPPPYQRVETPKVYIHLRPQLVTGSMGEEATRAKQHLWTKATALQSIRAAAGPNVPEPLIVVHAAPGQLMHLTALPMAVCRMLMSNGGDKPGVAFLP